MLTKEIRVFTRCDVDVLLSPVSASVLCKNYCGVYNTLLGKHRPCFVGRLHYMTVELLNCLPWYQQVIRSYLKQDVLGRASDAYNPS